MFGNFIVIVVRKRMKRLQKSKDFKKETEIRNKKSEVRNKKVEAKKWRVR